MAEEQFNIYKPRSNLPVDTGWAWIVLTASFMVMFIMQGTLRTFGIVFVELQRSFQTSSSMISAVLTTHYIANSLSSLLVLNCLSKSLSSRTMIIIGSVLCALTYILDSLAKTASILPLFHVLTGFGLAFMYGPNYVNIANYFNKYRGSATAFVSCGSSIGQLLFSPLAVLLISEYGINGAMLLSGGIFLQCTIFAMLLRPPSFYEKTLPKDQNSTKISSTFLSCLNRETTKPESLVMKHDGSKRIHRKLSSNLLGSTSDSKCLRCTNSQEKTDTRLTEREVETETEMKKLETNGELSSRNESYQNMKPLGDVQTVDNEQEIRDFITFKQTEPEGSASESFLMSANENVKRGLQRSNWREIIGFVGCKLFKENIYSMYFVASSISMTVSLAPQTYFPSHANDIGLDEKEGAFFVAVAGFADLGGHILTMLIADRKFLNRSRFLGVVLISHGLIGCCIPFYKSFWTFSAYCISYGASGGIVFSMSPSILIDFIGESRFSQGLGFVYTFNAALASLYYTLLGYLRDITGAYLVGFGINSFCLIFSGILFLSEACIKY